MYDVMYVPGTKYVQIDNNRKHSENPGFRFGQRA